MGYLSTSSFFFKKKEMSQLLLADENGAELKPIEEEWCLVIESTLKRPTPVAEVIGQVSQYKSLPTEPWKPSPILFFPSLSKLSGRAITLTLFCHFMCHEFCLYTCMRIQSLDLVKLVHEEKKTQDCSPTRTKSGTCIKLARHLKKLFLSFQP